MNKRSRLIIVLAVLALCFWALWPSIKWYAGTPKEDQALALSTLEKIKDYSAGKASEDLNAMIETIKSDRNALVSDDMSWLKKAVKKNYKLMGKDFPDELTLYDAVTSFSSRNELLSLIEGRYRDPILKNKKTYENSVKLGLDLSGGMSVLVKADLDAVLESQKESELDEETIKKNAMDQAIEMLTARIDTFGLSSPLIRQQGDDHIYIELPGAAETSQINSIIMGSGILNFRLVDSDASAAFNSYYSQVGQAAFDSQGRLIDNSVIPEDCEVLGYYTTDDYGLDQRQGYLVVKKEVALEGRYIESAEVSTDNFGRPTVNFKLDSDGAVIFGEVTGAHVHENLAIVSDNKIKSSATINEAITGGSVQISGFGSKEAQNLRKVLQTGFLEVPLSVESQQVIGASLGNKAIFQGIWAIAIGLISIMLFMLIWYKGAGFNACVVQILNLYIMFSILSALNFTITLPSIAGMILTIGMAVDANVIIFERIKEERVLGKDRATSINSGFSNALWSILDSNITTFIAAAFMSQLGSGAIQGFAYSLAIGVVSTLFTSLVVSRLMFDFQTETIHKTNISISWRIK